MLVCNTIENVKNMVTILKNKLDPTRVAYIEGKTYPKKRTQILDGMRSGGIQVLVVCRTCTVGTDIPLLTTVMFVDQRFQPDDVAQSAQRCLRKHKYKTFANIVFPMYVDDENKEITQPQSYCYQNWYGGTNC